MKIIAFKGRSGGLNTYTALINAQELSRYFSGYFELAANAKTDSDPFNRAQRLIDMKHVNKIKQYLDRSTCVMGSPVATANMLHAGETPSFDNDVPVLFVDTTDLVVKQQIFSDINSTPAKVSAALNLVYDHTQSLSSLIPNIVPKALLEVEKATVSKKSPKLLTTTIMREAIAILLDTTPATLNSLSASKLSQAWAEWSPYVSQLFRVYQTMGNEAGSFEALRTVSILPHNVGLLAVMRLLPSMKAAGWKPEDLSQIADLHHNGLANRDHPHWEGRCVSFGNMKKSTINIDKTAALLGHLLDVPMTGALAMLAPEEVMEDESEGNVINLMPALG